MSAPNLTIAVERIEAMDKMGRAQTAAGASTAPNQADAIKVTIRNNAAYTVVASTLTVSVPGIGGQTPCTIALHLPIPSDTTVTRIVTMQAAVFMPREQPAQIRFSVACLGFAHPATASMTLCAEGPSVAGGFQPLAFSMEQRVGAYC